MKSGLRKYQLRNLYRTVEYLLRNNLTEEVVGGVEMKKNLLLASSLERDGKFFLAYEILLCRSCIKDTIVLCSCCSPEEVFVRNHNLIRKGRGELPVVGAADDPFALYLLALNRRSSTLMQEVMLSLPECYEAMQHLVEFSESYRGIGQSVLELEYKMLLKVERDIDVCGYVCGCVCGGECEGECIGNKCECIGKCIGEGENVGNTHCNNNTHSNTQCNTPIHNPIHCNTNINSYTHNNTPVHTHTLSLNLRAAYAYAVGKLKLAHTLFMEVLVDMHNIMYIEVYAFMLYTEGEVHKLQSLAERVEGCMDRYTVCYVMGINMAMGKKPREAIRLLKSAAYIKEQENRRNKILYTLIAKMYEILYLEENLGAYKQKAIENITKAIVDKDRVTNNIKVLTNVANIFYNLKMFEHSLYFCKRITDIRENPSIYKLMGRIFYKFFMYEDAISCFTSAYERGESDSLLYQAELYKKINRGEEAIKCYREYVTISKECCGECAKCRNKEKIVEYLVEYYEEKGDMEESMKYKNIF